MQGILTAPRPFKCAIVPRSTAKAETIEREFADAIETFLPFEHGLEPGEKDWVEKTRGR